MGLLGVAIASCGACAMCQIQSCTGMELKRLHVRPPLQPYRRSYDVLQGRQLAAQHVDKVAILLDICGAEEHHCKLRIPPINLPNFGAFNSFFDSKL